MAPTPTAIRLLRPSALAGARLPPPILGLGSWSEAPDAALVVFASEHEGIDAVLPDASTLPAGTLAILPAEVATRGGLFARLLPPGRLTREARAAAFLAHGYQDIASSADLVWARA